MEDTDLIACIYPDTQDASISIRASSRYVAPPVSSPPRYGRSDRETTQPPGLEHTNDPSLPCIQLRFSDVPRTSHGVVFGASANSDVVLPDAVGISSRHFSLTFDERRRLIVKDWGSLLGTEVSYDNEGRGKRSRFQWIVGGHEIPEEKKRITITVESNISFQIIVARHNITSQAYIDQVDRFCRGTAIAEDLFGDLGLPDRRTGRHTGTHTPGTGAIHLKKTLGEGGYGIVTHYWDVSTGEEFALKRPPTRALQKGRFNANAWRYEAHIMGLISHPNVIQLLGAEFEPYPQLRLEYVRGGSLDDQQGISIAESVSVLRQCLSALEYLHGGNPPIVHRDIKPSNILVQHRDAASIHVKLGDFGLSKDYDNLSTICGTWYYIAPEIYQNKQSIDAGKSGRMSYTAAVDVWSLGVVVYELLCPLPKYKERYISSGTAWAEAIIEKFQKDLVKRADGLRQLLLHAMVVLSPNSRCSARECNEAVENLTLVAEGGCQTPALASYTTEEEEESTNRYGPEDHTSDDQLVRQPNASSEHYSTISNDAGRRIRSGAPPPQSSSSAAEAAEAAALLLALGQDGFAPN